MSEGMASPERPIAADILRRHHVRFFVAHLRSLPFAYCSLDTNRIMAVYLCVNALDVLGALDAVPDRAAVIEWIYLQQVGEERGGGFIGGGFSGRDSVYSQSHISMTYTALVSLTILGDDLSRVNSAAVMSGLRRLQQPDGCFMAVPFGTESDTRFVFCAAAICFMLQDWSGIDADAAVRFVLSTRSFDGGVGLQPGLESHGGSCYCGVATLALLGRLDSYPDRESLVRFCVSRVCDGFNGRVNKPADTCYTFWVGGTLQILEALSLLDFAPVRAFILSCQDARRGGFAKLVGNPPDVLHAHYSVCGLSLMDEPGFRPLCAVLGITRRAFGAASFREGRCANGSRLL